VAAGNAPSRRPTASVRRRGPTPAARVPLKGSARLSPVQAGARTARSRTVSAALARPGPSISPSCVRPTVRPPRASAPSRARPTRVVPAQQSRSQAGRRGTLPRRPSPQMRADHDSLRAPLGR
jgi:hypothetical protein